MNKSTTLALGACLSLASFGAYAHSVDVEGSIESSGDGYINDGSNVLKTGLGGCLQTGTKNEDNIINKCEGIEEEVVEAVEEEVQAAEVEAPEPPAQTAKIDTREFSLQPTFATNSAVLDNSNQALMSGMFDELSAYKGITSITVVGHTDSRGSEEYNQALSEQRAATVAAEIGMRYPTARIDVQGMGELAPAASNFTEEGRQQNRRVDVAITATRMTFN